MTDALVQEDSKSGQLGLATLSSRGGRANNEDAIAVDLKMLVPAQEVKRQRGV